MISGEFPYEYAYAGKTGYTNAGQTTLATYAKKDTMNLVAVVLGCPGENDAAYEDTKKLLEHCFANYDTLSENSTKTLMLTEQNDLLSDTPAKMPETESAVTDTDTQSAIINAVKGHSWQDYIVIGAIALAAVVLIVLIIRQTVIYAKRRRRRKNYERMKKQRIEEEKENNS
jgi:D-alanyl-D-alanine carboxypeptidase (penicillin-binding protein 5/6)